MAAAVVASEDDDHQRAITTNEDGDGDRNTRWEKVDK
jgi:hypothetical protein